jgi:hypothetical protein
LQIKGLTSAVEAFKKIYAAGGPFVSRGDKSGTNVKELALWQAAGLDPRGKPWYLEVGQGMEKTSGWPMKNGPRRSPTGAPGWPPRIRTGWRCRYCCRAIRPCSTSTG